MHATIIVEPTDTVQVKVPDVELTRVRILAKRGEGYIDLILDLPVTDNLKDQLRHLVRAWDLDDEAADRGKPGPLSALKRPKRPAEV